MSDEAQYRIIDEARPGRLASVAVNPSWPLFAVMVAGTWLSWPWFVVNSLALGSPTRRKEIAIAALGFAVTAGMAVALLWMVRNGIITTMLMVRLGVLAIVVWKLGLTYALHSLQNRTFWTYEYYGGKVRNGLSIVVAGSFAKGFVLGLFDDLVWRIIVSGEVVP